jgi:predicted enzyme related to lactoylglutathione lyase
MNKGTLTAGRNVISWFEIPVRRIADVSPFYEAVFNYVIVPHNIGGKNYGVITGIEPYPAECYGAFVEYPEHEPLPCVPVHFFGTKNCSDFLAIMGRVVPHGGKVLMPPSPFNPIIGTSVLCEDNTGNKFAIHSDVNVYPCNPPEEPELTD